MCGRFVLISDLAEVTGAFPVEEVSGTPRRSFNIAPGGPVSVILLDEIRKLVPILWGYPPPWTGGTFSGKMPFIASRSMCLGMGARSCGRTEQAYSTM